MSRRGLLSGLLPALTACCLLTGFPSQRLEAQSRLSVDKVYKLYLQNSGTIMEKGLIKGYYFFYQSDKVDRHTNEYTLQVLDQNLNKVSDIKFEDGKKVSLLESAYNGTSLTFLFKNEETKTLDMKIYDFSGKLLYTYSRGFDKKTDELMEQYQTMHTDEGMNKNVFDIGGQGYVSVLPMREGKQRTYEVDCYSSVSNKQWTYIPNDDAEKYAYAEYLGSTDSLILLDVLKRNHQLSGKVSSHLVGINFITKKKVFDVENAGDEYNFVASNVVPLDGGRIMVAGGYYDKDQDIGKDYSKGMAIYEINSSGKILTKAYNTWAGDFARYLPTNRKGKIDDVGYLYIHKVIRTPDNKIFMVGEGYKRTASAVGIALTVLSRGNTNAGVTKIMVTDMVLMQFNDQYKVVNATIYDKQDNTVVMSKISDYNSQHTIAIWLKTIGAFDYNFTTSDNNYANFAVCYSDWVRTSEYKGQTFNTIRYNGTKFTTDHIELKSKASNMLIFPAKAGSVMIFEYFKKDKRVDMRIEKVG